MTVETRNNIITIVLGVVIVVLGWFLYRSIVEPYEIVEQRQEMIERVRTNMTQVRDALVQYEREYDTFPPTEGGLDSLMQFVRNDSMMVAQRDSFFQDHPEINYTFELDSLIYSPRPPHQRFEYTLNDTINPPLYLLADPDTTYDDRIGSLERANLLNAPSWR